MENGESSVHRDETEYDKVTQASLNGIYVKAQELDRGHNEKDAPVLHPPGATGDTFVHATDAIASASKANSFSDVDINASDAQAHASAESFSKAEADTSDAETRASDAQTHSSDSQTHASTNVSDHE